MKIEIKQMKEEKPLPKLMISDEGAIVLFERENVGIALKHPDGMHFSQCWAMNHFKDFEGSVVLSND